MHLCIVSWLMHARARARVCVCVPFQVLKWKAKVGKRNDDDLEERQVLESAEGGIVTSLLAPQVARASGRDTR